MVICVVWYVGVQLFLLVRCFCLLVFLEQVRGLLVVCVFWPRPVGLGHLGFILVVNT